jgi:hypothetical protein
VRRDAQRSGRAGSLHDSLRRDALKEKDGGSTESHFVFDGDTFYQGLGDFGLKAKDGTVVACVSNGIYRLKAGKCSKHTLLGTWGEKPAQCVLTKEGFEVKGDTGGKLTFQGSILLSDDPALMKAEKVADLAAGKAKLQSN